MTVLPLLVVQNDVDDPPARLGEWLQAAGLELDVRAMFAGAELPPDLGGHGGLVVLGGAAGAYDDHVYDWLPALRTLLAQAHAEQLPTLGICLGAQLLAVATGGRVERGGQGPEIGAQLIAKRAAAATDPLFGPMPITPDVLQYHYDGVTQLPPGAVLLASSPNYEVQAFRLGRVVWGLQCHIETTPQMVRDWAAGDEQLQDYDLTRLLERSDAAHPHIEQAWAPFAQRFADVARDPAAVKVGAAPPMSTAEPVTDPAAIRAALAQQMQSARAPMTSPAPMTFGRPPGSVG